MPDLKNTCAFCQKPMDDDGVADITSHDYLCTCPYPIRTAALKTIGVVPSTFLGRAMLAFKLAGIGIRAALKTMHEPDLDSGDETAYIVLEIKCLPTRSGRGPSTWPAVYGFASGSAILLADQLGAMSQLVRSTEYGMHTEVYLQAGFTNNYEFPTT